MKIGYAFSGGGARGFAHLGVAQAFYERGIKPDVISGTSAGAIAGAFLAAGYIPKRTFEIISEINFLKYFRPAISISGLVKLEKISAVLLEYFPEDNFSALEIPLTIAAVNYSKGEVVHFQKGELIKPMIASASIPVVFDPIDIGGDKYIDGGVMNNLPAHIIRDQVDYLIGVNCNPVAKESAEYGMKGMLERVLLMAINYNTMDHKQYCDLFIQPDKLANYKVFSISKAKEIYDIGYDYTQALLQERPDLLTRLGAKVN
jgi:NTE family protein